jgi:5-enolpyruvylshikimate-3-phosphate synthase
MWEPGEILCVDLAASCDPATMCEKIVIDTYEDHRMAMAFAPVALTNGCVVINEPQVVSKSYPNYWEDLKAVGFRIEELKN